MNARPAQAVNRRFVPKFGRAVRLAELVGARGWLSGSRMPIDPAVTPDGRMRQTT